MSRAALMLAIVAATAPAACGGGSSAATDAATGGDVAMDAVVMSCDPFTQNCPAGSKCDLVCNGTTTVACRADNGGGAPHSVCSSSIPCAKGTGCLTLADAGSTCMKFCAGDGDCATGERCHNVDVTLCGGPLEPMFLHICY
jgi:hypothetical protein